MSRCGRRKKRNIPDRPAFYVLASLDHRDFLAVTSSGSGGHCRGFVGSPGEARRFRDAHEVLAFFAAEGFEGSDDLVMLQVFDEGDRWHVWWPFPPGEFAA